MRGWTIVLAVVLLLPSCERFRRNADAMDHGAKWQVRPASRPWVTSR